MVPGARNDGKRSFGSPPGPGQAIGLQPLDGQDMHPSKGEHLIGPGTPRTARTTSIVIHVEAIS